MNRTKEYFPIEADAPEPLMVKTSRRVRFEEVDLLGMVWHGRYPSYFEDGRIAFGDTFGLSYQNFIDRQTAAPIVKMHFDYKTPLRFDELFTIVTSLHWTEATRLDFSYSIKKPDNTVAATGYTVQLLTELDGSILLIVPDWMQNFRNKWREGWWENK